MCKYIKNITWANETLTKKEVNESVKAALNEEIDPGLKEICKKLEFN